MPNEIKFKIADIVFKLSSRYPQAKQADSDYLRRYAAFICRGRQKADIKIRIDVAKELPKTRGKELFAVYEPASGFERWRLFQYKRRYIYQCPMRERRVTAFINRQFSRIHAFIPAQGNIFTWQPKDMLYDLMQVVLINYFAYHENGLFLHAAAVKDNGRALVFAGRSESGKSTSARLWHKHSRAVVLNDDRVIVRKSKNGFTAYSSPWHGEFGHSVTALSAQAPLKGLFILRHARKNIFTPLKGAAVFQALYPVLFPVFWDKNLSQNNLALCDELSRSAKVGRLGFAKGKRVIDFVRKATNAK